MEKKKIYKTEFHVHTRYSKDSILPFWLLIMMLKIKKINTIAITDHNEIAGAIKFKKKFLQHGIELIVGEEIFTNKGEIIGLGLSKKIESNLSPSETIKQIREQNGLVYVPHPYDEKRYKTVLVEDKIKKNKNSIDFIEVNNGRNISVKFDDKQNQIAEKYNIQKIIGSDAHTFFEVGRNYIITKSKVTVDNAKDECCDATFVGKKCINFAHKWTKVARIMTFICKGDFHGIIRIIKKKFTRGK